MRQTQQQLADICQSNLMTEKILITENYSAGNQLKENITKNGINTINLKSTTLLELAIQQSKNMVRELSLEIVDNDLLGIYTDMIIRKQLKDQKLKYFHKLQASPGFLKSMKNSLIELRMAGIESKSLMADHFVNTNKADDIRLILKELENLLVINKQIDTAGLYKIALGIANEEMGSKWRKRIYIIPGNTRYSQLEQQYLQHLTGGIYEVIGTDKQENQLANMVCSNLNLTKAYGVINETAAVIRDIKRNKTLLDNNLILHTVQEPYTQLLYLLCERHNLPVTFSEGISISNTKAGKLISSLLEWIQNNYQEQTFKTILKNSYLLMEGEKPSYQRIQKVLGEAHIGWDRNRYLKALDSYGIEENEKAKEKDQETIDWLKLLVTSLLDKIPEVDGLGRCDLRKLAEGLADIIKEYHKPTSELNAIGKEAVLGRLEILENYQGESMPQSEALLLISDTIGDLRVCSTGPTPGKIHVASYRKGLFLDRKNTFIIGLDSSKFPGQAIEDPILLDIERKRISQDLPLIKEQVKDNEQDMMLLLEEITEELTLSYSCYNTTEHKEQNPAGIFLQVYRLLEMDGRKSYKDLNEYLKKTEGYIDEDEEAILNLNEWWLKKTDYDHNKVSGTLLSQLYPGMAAGQMSRQHQESPDFTQYDGKINFDMGRAPIFSASQLEKLAKCPYLYFLSHILGLWKQEEFKYSMEVWLDPLNRGSLLHKIYELFLLSLKDSKEKPSLEKHKELIEKIADEEIEKMKKEIPPPSERVYLLEKGLLLEDCRYFIKIEENRTDGFLPEYFEMPFGFDKENRLTIELNSGKKISVRGLIDRVDKRGTDEYKIIDYKTGSAYGFGHNEYFNNGRHIQHALYAIALEKTLKEQGLSQNPKIVESGYLFPTVKGQGQWIGRDASKKDSLYQLLEDLLEIFDEGSFIRSDNKDKSKDNPCSYCDYLLMCQNYDSTWIGEKTGNTEDKGILAKGRLKCYE